MARCRRSLTVAGALALLIALTGCGPVNEGTARATEFHQRFSGEPDVIAVDVSGSNTLPWAGTVTGWLTLDPEVSDARFCELVHVVGDFQARHRTSWGITVESGPWAMEVDGDRTVDDERCTRLTQLRGDTVLAGAVLEEGTILVAVDGEAEPARGYDAAAEIVRPDREFTVLGMRPDGVLRSDAADWAYSVSSDRDGGRPDAAFEAHDAAAAAVEVERARLSPTGASLVIRTFREYDRADSAVAALRTADFAISIEALDVSIEREFTPVTRAFAEVLLDAAGVEHIAIGPTHVTVQVTDLDDVAGVESAIASIQADERPLVNLRSPDDATPAWGISGDAPERATRFAIVEAALATGVVDRISATVTTLSVELGDEHDDALRELGRALRAVVPTGQGVQITGDEIGFRFDAAPTLTEVDSFRDAEPTAFLAGWNGE